MYRLTLFLLLVACCSNDVYPQVETVPATHPVYTFLKRMEVRGVLTRFFDAVLPLGRKEVAALLMRIREADARLTSTERTILLEYLSEFQFEITGTTEGFLSVVDGDEPSLGTALREELTGREKFLYALTDSAVTMFVNGLLTIDLRRITGDALGSAHTEFVQFGGRIRGTVLNRVGYYLQGTNAQFWGSRNLLYRDPVIRQAYTLGVLDAQNFDFSEGYIRYDGGILSAQLGRERVVWGLGYDQKMVASENVRTFDFLRADFQYKAIKYTFLHGNLLGRRGAITFSPPGDTSTTYSEPVVADKYFASHRIEFSFPDLFDIGFQEMAIYSNRSIDLAYLNPFHVFESTQRSREERDNVFWAFDIQTHFLNGLELHGTIVFDDLHFTEFFEPRWYNRYAYQAGLMIADPLFVRDMTLMLEYTRVKPFVYAHDRSRENTYTSLNSLLGPRIGPNADSWFIRWDYFPLRNLTFSLRVLLSRKGENVYDAQGRLVKNVGGDVFQGHRAVDPLDAVFLDGNRVTSRSIELYVTYEPLNQIWLEGWFQRESIQNGGSGTSLKNSTGGIRLRAEL